MGLEDIDERADQVPKATYGSFACFAQHGLESGEGLFDRIEVRAIWWKEARGCACCCDLLPHCCAFVVRQVVHNNHVAGEQLRHQHLGDIGLELVTVDRSIEYHRRDHLRRAKPCDQRGGLAVSVRVTHPQAFALWATAMAAGHVGGGPGLVNKDQAFRLQIELAVEPCVTLPQDVGTVLLDRVPGLFLRVIA